MRTQVNDDDTHEDREVEGDCSYRDKEDTIIDVDANDNENNHHAISLDEVVDNLAEENMNIENVQYRDRSPILQRLSDQCNTDEEAKEKRWREKRDREIQIR